MRSRSLPVLLATFTLTCGVVLFAAAPVAKPAAAKPAAAKKAAVPAKAGTRKPAPGKTTARTTSRTTAKKGAKVRPAPSRSRQMVPTPERYREIQQALVEKGYLKTEPTGVWGPECVEALKQFQAEQNIPVSGKLNSRSIIGLGLGPKTAGPLVVPPPEPSSTRPPF